MFGEEEWFYKFKHIYQQALTPEIDCIIFQNVSTRQQFDCKLDI